MMNESYWTDNHYHNDNGLELQSLDSNDSGAARRPPRIVLTPPPEWLDHTKALPTDKEFHRWITEQLRQRRRHHNGGDDMSCSSGRSDSSQLSATFGRTIREVSSNLVAGVLRKRRNNSSNNDPSLMERQTLLEDDCFDSRDRAVVGMELSMLS